MAHPPPRSVSRQDKAPPATEREERSGDPLLTTARTDMPCATIHLLLADRAFDHWEREPGDAPFPPGGEGVRDAFLHGALAPDMGFVPGVDRFVSELSHYHRSGDLSRELLRTARSERQIAFAWGWITHVLGDVALHPLVGRACGELLHGDPSLRLNASEDLPTHVGMEVGLDIVYLTRSGAISPPPTAPVFSNGGAHQLTDALQTTYGIAWEPARILDFHRRAVRLTARWPAALRRLASGSLVSRAVVGTMRRLAPRGSAMAGFFRPIAPPAWMIEEVDSFTRTFPERVQDHLRSGLAALGNMNLETGLEEAASAGHPGQAQVSQRLMERRLLGTAF